MTQSISSMRIWLGDDKRAAERPLVQRAIITTMNGWREKTRANHGLFSSKFERSTIDCLYMHNEAKT